MQDADALNAEAREADGDAPPLPSEAAIRDILRERILRHFLPATGSALGIELRPFTLWHWRALEVIGCPYTPDGEWDLRIPQLCAAVHVLTLPPNSDAPLTPRGLTAIAWRVKAVLLANARGDRVAHEQLARLYDHVILHYEGPAKWISGNSTRVNAPGWLYLAGQLIALGFSEARAWSCTPGYARTLIAAIDVARGGSDFIGVEDVLDAIEAGHTLEAFGL